MSIAENREFSVTLEKRVDVVISLIGGAGIAIANLGDMAVSFGFGVTGVACRSAVTAATMSVAIVSAAAF